MYSRSRWHVSTAFSVSKNNILLLEFKVTWSVSALLWRTLKRNWLALWRLLSSLFRSSLLYSLMADRIENIASNISSTVAPISLTALRVYWIVNCQRSFLWAPSSSYQKLCHKVVVKLIIPLTPRSRVLIRKLIVAQWLTEFPALSGVRMLIVIFVPHHCSPSRAKLHRSHAFVPINITLHLLLGLPDSLISFKICTYVPSVPLMLHASLISFSLNLYL